MSNKTELFKLKSEIKSLEKHLNIAMSIMKSMEEAEKKAFEEIPGVTGTFDGEFMVTEKGEKFPVSANYAAKSLLLFGDKLKMVEEDGKPFFKNVSKTEAKEIEGILSKKEDVWYILADCGSYKISDTAAAFHGVEQNMEATALIPADNLKAPFAALKSVKGKEKEEKKPATQSVPVASVEKPKPQAQPKQQVIPEKKEVVRAPAPKVAPKPEPTPAPKPAPKPVESKPAEVKPAAPVPEQKKELPQTDATTTLDLDDDDLR